MPLSAMRRGEVDYVLPVEEIPRVITGLLNNGRPARTQKSKGPTIDAPSPERPDALDALRTGELKGPPSKLTCPDCGGALWELEEKGLVRYRCHVGHGFSSNSLRDGMDDKLEDTLWSALRALEENIELRTRMKTRASDRSLTAFSATLSQDIADLEQRAAALRHLLLGSRHHAKPRAEKPRKRQAHG